MITLLYYKFITYILSIMFARFNNRLLSKVNVLKLNKKKFSTNPTNPTNSYNSTNQINSSNSSNLMELKTRVKLCARIFFYWWYY